MEEKQASVDNDTITELSSSILKHVGDYSNDPYLQMAALRTAASAIEHKLTALSMRAGITAALTNLMRGGVA
jgi:hypothetical protein